MSPARRIALTRDTSNEPQIRENVNCLQAAKSIYTGADNICQLILKYIVEGGLVTFRNIDLEYRNHETLLE